MVGKLDKIFVPLAEQLKEKIPDSRLRIYDAVGHMLNLEAMDRCNRDIDNFLNEVEQSE